DWSSDVCSSDLRRRQFQNGRELIGRGPSPLPGRSLIHSDTLMCCQDRTRASSGALQGAAENSLRTRAAKNSDGQGPEICSSRQARDFEIVTASRWYCPNLREFLFLPVTPRNCE